MFFLLPLLLLLDFVSFGFFREDRDDGFLRFVDFAFTVVAIVFQIFKLRDFR